MHDRPPPASSALRPASVIRTVLLVGVLLVIALAAWLLSDVSRILNGNERGFSTDRLARIAFKLGYLPIVDLRPMPRAERARPKTKASGRAA